MSKAALNSVVWSNSALTQLQAIRAYIEQFNPNAAQDLASALIAAANSLASFPHRGRLIPGGNKRELMAVYPYIIRYRVVGNVVRILRVRHASRRPTAS